MAKKVSNIGLHLKPWVFVTVMAMAAGSAWAQADQDLATRSDLLLEDPVNTALGRQYFHDMWLFLSESEVTWIRTAAAFHFTGGFIGGFTGESDPGLRAEGERLLTAIIAAEPSDTHTLWLLLDACHTNPQIPGCASTQIGDRLIESAPDNAAVYLKAAGITNGSFESFEIEDSKTHRQTLLKASRAPRIDTYYGRDALELYHELKAFEEEYRPTHEPAMDQPTHYRAFGKAWTVFSLLQHMSFVGLNGLCESQVIEGRTEYVDACVTLAGTMQSTGKTLVSRALGYSLEGKLMEAMGADTTTALYLARKARISTRVSVCQLRAWRKALESTPELGEAAVITYLVDLQTVGEVAAIRNRAMRGYETNPDDYEQDPLVCEALMDLDSEAMGAALGDADPKRRIGSK